MKIDRYSHCFSITECSELDHPIVKSFCKRLQLFETVYEDGEKKYKATTVFASATKSRDEYRLHINLFDDFMGLLRAKSIVPIINIHEAVFSDIQKVVFIPKDLPPPREHQPPLIDYICSEESSPVITLQTGLGKTYTTLCAMHRLGIRTAYIMKSSFIERWEPEVCKRFKMKSKDIMIAKGMTSLMSLLEMVIDGEVNPKCIFITTTSITDYIKHYEEYGISDRTPYHPVEIYDILKVGMAVLDEGHIAPHQIMKIFTYTHVYKFVTLSATLETKNRFINEMYALMFPLDKRNNGGIYKVYIGVRSIYYNIENIKKYHFRSFMGYSHTTFEKSLLLGRNRGGLKNYLNLIKWSIDDIFTRIYQPKMKMFVFCSTINMCDTVKTFLSKVYPNWTIGRYCQKDTQAVFDTSDIIVTTLGSGGTAVDVPNLMASLCTVAVDSQISVEQVLGRTREPKDFPGQTPIFAYFTCRDIEAHMRYDNNKRDLFKNKVVFHATTNAPVRI